MKQKFLFILLLLIIISGQLSAQQPVPLPVDPQVRIGKLSNGLTYYIRHNEKPKDRADFYIVQKVGAILEDDKQNGLAHFLEHMSFNGTTHFPDKQLINFLEKNGVKFGENINAYTSLDETVYHLSNVPTLRQGTIDSSLLALHDWSHSLLLEDKAIDKERGVIREEWRTGANADRRMWKASNAILFAGSQYAKRDVIGDTAVINHFAYNTLRDYYKKWYRPDLQAIIVVGDIDVDKTEAFIQTLFGTIPKAINPAERTYYTIPDNEKPIIARITDPEASGTTFLIQYKQEPLSDEVKKSSMGYAIDVVNSLICRMINNRFDEISQKADAPFSNAASQYGDLVKTKDALLFYMEPRQGKDKEALTLMLSEIEKIKRFGFNTDEYERAKAEISKQIENAYNNRDQQNSASYVREYIGNFLHLEAIPGITWEYHTLRELLPNLPLEMLNKQAQRYITDRNVLVTIEGPDNEKSNIPTEDVVMAMIDAVKKADIQPNKQETIDKPLVANPPKAGTIAKESHNNVLDATEWELSNGVKVIIKPTKFKADDIRLLGIAYGGYSLVSDSKDLPSAMVSDNIITNSGVGEFSQIELNKLLAGKTAKITPNISDYQETFAGSSSIKDFETMMQLLYLYFTEPRKDADGYNSFINNLRTDLVNAANDPGQAFSDTVTTAIYCNSPRKPLFNLAALNKVNHDTAMRIYKERFGNPANFTFFLVGSIDEHAIKQFILTYLGGLKTDKNTETWKDCNIRYPESDVSIRFVHEMTTPKASNFVLYNDKIDYSLNNSLLVQALGNLLDLRYTATIREEEGGSYGVGVAGNIGRIPTPQVTLFIQFDTDPKLQEKMLGLIHKELQTVAESGPNEDDVQKVKENLKKQHKENVEENGWWISALNHYYFSHINLVNDFDKAIDNISAKTLQELAKRLMDKKNVLQVTMMPKGM
jgi:zinc protease